MLMCIFRKHFCKRRCFCRSKWKLSRPARWNWQNKCSSENIWSVKKQFGGDAVGAVEADCARSVKKTAYFGLSRRRLPLYCGSGNISAEIQRTASGVTLEKKAWAVERGPRGRRSRRQRAPDLQTQRELYVVSRPEWTFVVGFVSQRGDLDEDQQIMRECLTSIRTSKRACGVYEVSFINIFLELPVVRSSSKWCCTWADGWSKWPAKVCLSWVISSHSLLKRSAFGEKIQNSSIQIL